MKMIETSKKEAKWRLEHEEEILSKAEDLKRPCTVCRAGLFAKDAHRHPVLGVVVCQKCFNFYNCGEFSEDEEGDQKYCAWCGEGGIMNYCSKAKCGAFCKVCIKKNLGDKEFEKVTDNDWLCYLCNSKPLWKLRAYCNATIERMEAKKREKIPQNMLELLKMSSEEAHIRSDSNSAGVKSSEEDEDASSNSRRAQNLRSNSVGNKRSKSKPATVESSVEDQDVQSTNKNPPNQSSSLKRNKSKAAYADSPVENKNECVPSTSKHLFNQSSRSNVNQRNASRTVKTDSSEGDEDEGAPSTSRHPSNPLTGSKISKKREVRKLPPDEDLENEEHKDGSHVQMRNAKSNFKQRPGVDWIRSSLDDYRIFIAKNKISIKKFQERSKDLHRNSSEEEVTETCDAILDFYRKCSKAFELYLKYFKEDYGRWRKKLPGSDVAVSKGEASHSDSTDFEDVQDKEVESEPSLEETEPEVHRNEETKSETAQGKESDPKAVHDEELEEDTAQDQDMSNDEDPFADFDETLRKSVSKTGKSASPDESLKENKNPNPTIAPVPVDGDVTSGSLQKGTARESKSRADKADIEMDNAVSVEARSGKGGEEDKKVKCVEEREGDAEKSVSSEMGMNASNQSDGEDGVVNDLGDHDQYDDESEDTYFSGDEETNALKEEECLQNLLKNSDSEEESAEKTSKKRKVKNSTAKIRSSPAEAKLGRFIPSNWEEFQDDDKLCATPIVELQPFKIPKKSKRRTSRHHDSDNSETEIANLCNLDAVENPSATSTKKSAIRIKKTAKSMKLEEQDSSDSSADELAPASDPELDTPINRSPKDLDLQDESDDEQKAKNALLLDSDDEEDGGSDTKKKRLNKSKVKKRRIIEDSDDENTDWMKAKELNTRLDVDSTDEEGERKRVKVKKQAVDSDNSYVAANSETSNSDDVVLRKKPNKRKTSSKSDESDSDSDIFKDLKKSKKRKRIIQHESSDSECEVFYEGKGSLNSSGSPGKMRKRKILRKDELELATQQAAKEEKERIKRQQELQKLYNNIVEERSLDAGVNELVLEFDPKTKSPVVEIHKEIATKLKPHQIKGIKFMWNSVFESINRANSSDGSGCILAHCMGLGKTLQVVALVHTVLTNEQLNINTCLIVTPLTTVENWKNEFAFWTKDINYGDDLNVYSLSSMRPSDRKNTLLAWKRERGVMIISYDLYRNLANPQSKRGNKRERDIYQQTLVDEGPDLIVCDEGHVLKNEEKKLSLVMSRIKTKRRIILTGTPLQNNLLEYHCMVQFVKPNFLGNRKEFINRFVTPIKAGQHKESTPFQVKVMNKRACILHKMLEPSVQRYDYSVLKPHLQEKFEYVIKIKLTEEQIRLYSHFMENCARKMSNQKGACLFSDYQNLLRVWNHPYGLKLRALEDLDKENDDEDSAGSLKDFIDDDEGGSGSSSSESAKGYENSGSKRCTRQDVQNGQTLDDPKEMIDVPFMNTWWKGIISDEELELLSSGSKMVLLFSILKECQDIGDKILVFSQSLYALNLIEHFLSKLSSASEEERDRDFCGLQGDWDCGINYFRIDGSTNIDHRNNSIKRFNNPRNTEAKLFLVSTRAGGLGVNMVGANRVILFDASWNPSNDMQSIFRVYRFGQAKPCYIYRFLAAGTMEEKIYDRQVTKLALSGRVVDKQAIDRHFTQADLEELYSFNPHEESEDTPLFPKDRLLAELYNRHKTIIQHYFEHDSLLEDRPEEKLTAAEVQAAWEEFEQYKFDEIRRRESAALYEEQMRIARAASAQQYDLNSVRQHELNLQIYKNLASIQQMDPNILNRFMPRGPGMPPNMLLNPNGMPQTGYQGHVSSANRDRRMMNHLEDNSVVMLDALGRMINSQFQQQSTSGGPRVGNVTRESDNDDIQILPQPNVRVVPRSSGAGAPAGPSAMPTLTIRKDIFK
ncbi:Hypothetical predicted protein [Cloeon dipterum]|uniref:ATP-dependent helicase ATRX n=1 Tax=Cloeon dipterum TaxID=197152 RepID=A0A8S1BSK4_9INSE|nr:Hypothetical predicted protein [Cloeon dipterum]